MGRHKGRSGGGMWEVWGSHFSSDLRPGRLSGGPLGQVSQTRLDVYSTQETCQIWVFGLHAQRT